MYKRSIKDYIGNRKILYMLLAIALISVSTLTIVYAALSVTLNITGTADISAATWDVHLDNVKLNSKSVTATAPTITNGTTATFSTSLTTPGDFYEFTIDVVNNGSIDAMIDGITKTPTLTTAQAKYLNYIIEYQNGESINTKQLVAKNSFVRLKVRVEFRKDITASDLPTTSETLNLAFTVNYVQSDGTEESVTDNGIYDPYKIGTEKCFGTECFYVISSTDTTVTMISKYNLYVGSECTSSTSCVPYGDEATGIQDENMKGWVTNNDPKCGVTVFSSDTQKGTNYNDYSGSIVEGYVNNYKILLESNFGVEVAEARLITKDELTNSETFACSMFNNCSDKYPWIYSTSYWTGSAYSTDIVWQVFYSGSFARDFSYDTNYRFGVRPVIVISKSNF